MDDLNIRTAPLKVEIVVLMTGSAGEVVGIVQTVMDPRTREELRLQAKVEGDRVDYVLEGRPPTNEQGVHTACQWLVNALRERGEPWGNVVIPEEVSDVDAVSTHDVDTERTLRMQCVRAMVNPSYWAELRKSGIVATVMSVSEAAALLEAAIRKKAARIPEAQRRGLTLVLDATDTPVVALPAVLTAFSVGIKEGIVALGFESVWVIGPMPQLVAQLA